MSHASRALQPPPSSAIERTMARVATLEEKLRRIENSKYALIHTDEKRAGTPGNFYGIVPPVGDMVPISLNSTAGSPGTGSVPATLTYTPPVDVWAEVTAHNGSMLKQLDGYQGVYGGIRCSPADEDGIIDCLNIMTQHGNFFAQGPLTNAPRIMRRLFKLSAGTTYSLSMTLGWRQGSTNGADNHTYFIGTEPDLLFITMKCFIR